MNRPEPLRPAYDFSLIPEPVSLRRGAAEVNLGTDQLHNTAEVLLRFLPSPRMVLHASVQGTERLLINLALKNLVNPSLLFTVRQSKGFAEGTRQIPIAWS